MKAWLCHAYGAPEELTFAEVEPPVLTDGCLRIAVRAVGLNFPDLLMVQGKYQMTSGFPFSPGMECVGEVKEVGPSVTGFAIGDRVIAHPWRNCLAEEVIAPAELCFLAPASMPDEVAAGFGISQGTVYHALVDRARLGAGETLLVLGAAGGIGQIAVDMGKALGAKVIAVASSAEKRQIARDFGADAVLGYEGEEFRDQVISLNDGQGVDVVFDPVSGEMSRQALRCMRFGARLLVLGFASGEIASLASNHLLIKGVEVAGVSYTGFYENQPELLRENMAKLFQLYAADRLHPLTGHVLPFDRAVEGISLFASRKAVGKTVITL